MWKYSSFIRRSRLKSHIWLQQLYFMYHTSEQLNVLTDHSPLLCLFASLLLSFFFLLSFFLPSFLFSSFLSFFLSPFLPSFLPSFLPFLSFPFLSFLFLPFLPSSVCFLSTVKISIIVSMFNIIVQMEVNYSHKVINCWKQEIVSNSLSFDHHVKLPTRKQLSSLVIVGPWTDLRLYLTSSP